MAGEREMPGNEVASSNQLTAILFVSAAIISAGVFAFSKMPGCESFRASIAQPRASSMAIEKREKKNGVMDSEMRAKYRVMVSRTSHKAFVPEAAPRRDSKPLIR